MQTSIERRTRILQHGIGHVSCLCIVASKTKTWPANDQGEGEVYSALILLNSPGRSPIGVRSQILSSPISHAGVLPLIFSFRSLETYTIIPSVHRGRVWEAQQYSGGCPVLPTNHVLACPRLSRPWSAPYPMIALFAYSQLVS